MGFGGGGAIDGGEGVEVGRVGDDGRHCFGILVGERGR